MTAHSISRPHAGKSRKPKKSGVLPGVQTTLKKPRPDFPLSIHKASGTWCKKVRGRIHYYGKIVDDPKGVAALERWLEEKDDLLAGREPRVKTAGLTVEDLCFRFLAHHEERRNNGELNPRTYQGYFATAETTAKTIGRKRTVVDLVPDDFRKLRSKLAETRGLVALRNEMQRVRSIFKFAFDEGLIVAPVRFGKGFDKPPMDAVDRAREAKRTEHGDRMFQATEIRTMLNGKTITEEDGSDKFISGASQPMKAMILLAANCGFGQTDLSSLPINAVNLETGWVDFPRPKTAVRRRCPLWPETMEAIREWLVHRPTAKHQEDARLLFLTRRGQRWVKLNATGSPADALGQEFGKLVLQLGLKRPGVSFYALRHGFETIAGETADQVAVNYIMGHKDGSMAGVHRERIGDDRLKTVSDHVRAWLYGLVDSPKDDGAKKPKAKGTRKRKPSSKTKSADTEASQPQLCIVG